MSSNNPSVPPTNGICHFLELPAELRCMIYEFSLSQAEGIQYRPGSDGKTFKQRTKGSMPNSSESDANQLKYVSRQLFRETRDLEIRYNDLYFKTFEEAVKFLEIYPKADYRHLRIIDIDETLFARDPGPLIGAMFQFCIKNPHVLVREHCDGYKSNSAYFVLSATQTRYYFKTELDFAQRTVPDENRDAFLQPPISTSDMAKRWLPFPQNYRIFPAEDRFDEQAFRKAVNDELDNFRDDLQVNEDRVESWVTLAKEIFEHGV
ncbi:Nn.00g005680.m01.CDS01 [Neocucurbitaria sp. VM-36]